MAAYRAMVEGKNVLLSQGGKVSRHGFFQTVFVMAPDVASAEAAALSIVKGDEALRAQTLNAANDPPILYVESLYDAEGDEVPDSPRGRTYYLEKKWWQFWK